MTDHIDQNKRDLIAEELSQGCDADPAAMTATPNIDQAARECVGKCSNALSLTNSAPPIVIEWATNVTTPIIAVAMREVVERETRELRAEVERVNNLRISAENCASDFRKERDQLRAEVKRLNERIPNAQ